MTTAEMRAHLPDEIDDSALVVVWPDGLVGRTEWRVERRAGQPYLIGERGCVPVRAIYPSGQLPPEVST